MTRLLALPILEISTFAVVTLACALAIVPGADELVLNWITRSSRGELELTQTLTTQSEPQFVAENSAEDRPGSAEVRLADKNEDMLLVAPPSGTAATEPDSWEFQDLPAIELSQQQSQSPSRHHVKETDPVFRSLPPSTRDTKMN